MDLVELTDIVGVKGECGTVTLFTKAQGISGGWGGDIVC
jgi:hypothetical protein